jgi:hypothetical protein
MLFGHLVKRETILFFFFFYIGELHISQAFWQRQILTLSCLQSSSTKSNTNKHIKVTTTPFIIFVLKGNLNQEAKPQRLSL